MLFKFEQTEKNMKKLGYQIYNRARNFRPLKTFYLLGQNKTNIPYFKESKTKIKKTYAEWRISFNAKSL